MNKLQIINTVLQGIIAFALIWIAIEQSKPHYQPVPAGVIDAKTGKIYNYDGIKMVPVE